jgi:hypothetical protein
MFVSPAKNMLECGTESIIAIVKIGHEALKKRGGIGIQTLIKVF